MAEPDEATIPEESMQPVDAKEPDSPEGPNVGSSRSRKRTKTGCLTCRKRRIKCGEERPICANCVKSKRNCEGYAPRLTFKDPVGAYPQGWPIRGYQLPPGVEAQYLQHPSTGSMQPQFPLIAPRPLPEHNQYINAQVPTQQRSETAYETNGHPQQQHVYPPILPNPPSQMVLAPLENDLPSTSSSYGPIDARWTPSGPSHSLPLTQSLVAPSPPRNNQSLREIDQSTTQPNLIAGSYIYEAKLPDSTFSPASYIPVASHSSSGYRSMPLNGIHTPRNEHQNMSYPNHPAHNYSHDNQAYTNHQGHPAIAQLHEEDEYYDVETDEEMPDADNTNTRSIQKRQRDLSHVLAISGQGRNLRSVEAFLYQPNVLTTYAPRYTSSPLMDEATARIFCHFVTATGPLMSAYGRHPVNPALLFSGTPVPKSQQALWTYTIPMMAISNQALLHAILAVASLNIARLQQAPLTVPIKHYQFALRRVAKAVATPRKRTAMATVAATILLSQFEILSAEHSKWHSHLAGARQLLTEIDFAQWTDRIHHERERRAAAAAAKEIDVNGSQSNYRPALSTEALPWIPEPGSADEDVLNKIIGTSIRKDFHGHTQKTKPSQSNRPVTEKEMDDFQTYRDLFWMYTKIDNIQSFVSGRRLLLPLDRWIHCPPRAAMNRIDAVYGTLDYVALLLGRVADFAGKDVIRKRRAVKASGGVWRPPPGMFGPPGTMSTTGMSGPPGSSGPPVQESQMPSPPTTGSMPSTPGKGLPPLSSGPPPTNPASAAPTFNGLLPETDQVTNMPAAFTQAPRDILYKATPTDSDVELNEATAVAETEWNNIQEAFHVFEQNLGSNFAPLSVDAGPAVDTPFGPALQYRTFQIATCWLLFYMARIIAIRTHPSMPPASMIAAGVAAGKTAQFCNTIGRINFGLQTPAPNQPLNPIFGGAITEMMLPMFVAGVQYTDNAQRMATIERLQFIADRIGHDSAALIAAGLEKTWIKMHEAGRGPKYNPSVRVQDEYGRDLTEYERNQPNLTNGEIRVPRGPARDLQGRETSKNKNRGAVILQPDTRSFAAGVLGLEDSFKGLNVEERIDLQSG